MNGLLVTLCFLGVLTLPLNGMQKDKFARPRSKSNPPLSELMLGISKLAEGAQLTRVSNAALSLTDQETHPTAVYTRALKAKSAAKRKEYMAKAALIGVDRISDAKKEAATKSFNESIQLAHENWATAPAFRRNNNPEAAQGCLRVYENEIGKAKDFYRESLRATRREDHNLPVDEGDLELEVTKYFLKLYYEWHLESVVYYAEELSDNLAKSMSPRSQIGPLIKLFKEEKVNPEVAALLESLDKEGVPVSSDSLPPDKEESPTPGIRKRSDSTTSFARLSVQIKSKVDMQTFKATNELMAEQLVHHLHSSKSFYMQWKKLVNPGIQEQALADHTNACFEEFKQNYLSKQP